MVRIIASPQGELGVDRYLKAPGRGAHLCYDPACLEKAARRKAFGRAFREPLAPVDPEVLRQQIIQAVETRIRDALAIGRGAGWTVSGADVLERAMERGLVKLVVIATDASEGTARRLRSRCEAAGIPVASYLDREALGRTQGQENRAAVGITHAPLAERLLAELQRRDRVLVAAAPQRI
jgi:ribosomal protein L7Ae-like RNA K-turn-binding protein